MIHQVDGIRAGRCLDGESLDIQPGGPVHVFPCTKRWHQFLSFGDGIHVPKGSLHTTVDLHTRRRIEETGREQEPYMCLGVAGRGDKDEEDWFGEREEYDDGNEMTGSGDEDGGEEEETDAAEEIDEDNVENDTENDGLQPLSEWEDEQLIATRCSNVGAVIEWVLVPFIEEEEEEEEQDEVQEANSSESINAAEDEEEL